MYLGGDMLNDQAFVFDPASPSERQPDLQRGGFWTAHMIYSWAGLL